MPQHGSSQGREATRQPLRAIGAPAHRFRPRCTDCARLRWRAACSAPRRNRQRKEHPMLRRIAPTLLLLTATTALAEPLAGNLEDRALRRKTDMVYLEKVDGVFPPAAQKPVVNQRGNTYLPHVIPLVVGTTLVFQSE